MSELKKQIYKAQCIGNVEPIEYMVPYPNLRALIEGQNIKYGKNLSKISLALDTKKDLLRIRKILNISKKVDTDFFKYVSIAKKL